MCFCLVRYTDKYKGHIPLEGAVIWPEASTPPADLLQHAGKANAGADDDDDAPAPLSAAASGTMKALALQVLHPSRKDSIFFYAKVRDWACTLRLRRKRDKEPNACAVMPASRTPVQLLIVSCCHYMQSAIDKRAWLADMRVRLCFVHV